MKRLLFFVLLLSFISHFTFYQAAVPSPDGADAVMGRFSLVFCIVSFVIAIALFTSKRHVVWSAAGLSAVFFIGIHPNLPLNSWPVLVGFAAMAAGFFVAIAIDHLYVDAKDGKDDGVFSRIVVSAALGLGGAIVAQHLAYKSPTGETLSLAVAIEAVFFVIAFFVAPRRLEDTASLSPRALWKRFGKRTAN